MLIQTNYIIIILILFMSLMAIVINSNLFKKIFALGLFQSAILIFYISIARVKGGKIPIINLDHPDDLYTNPLPHILMLTAIVVGVSTLAVGLSIIINISNNHKSIDDKEIILELEKYDK